MKHKVFLFVIFLLFFFMMSVPDVVLSAAAGGLIMWFQTVLPTLFPFLVITGMMIKSDAVYYVSRLTGGMFSSLFHISGPAVFAVLGGFLCGYPMGAKITSDLIISNKLTREEGEYLLSFCNNTSPAFIVSYIFLQNLHKPDMALISLSALVLSPVFCSFLFRRWHKVESDSSVWKQKNLRKLTMGELLDDCITDSSETIMKIGGYIIVFQIVSAMMSLLPIHGFLWDYILLPAVEITGGIRLLSNADLRFEIRYILIMALTSFGGLCAIFQTQCMVKESGLSIGCYIKEKLVTALVTSLISIWILIFFHN